MATYRKFKILAAKKVRKSPTVSEAVSDFLLSKKAMNCTKATVQFYTDSLKPFQNFCALQEIKELAEVDNFLVDAYFADMADKGHSPGGVFAYYRSLRTFMKWAWLAYSFDTTCPTDIAKVKAPPVNPIPGIPEKAVLAILEEAKHTDYPQRDIAFIMFLVDTGARKQEAANIKIKDVNLETGEVFIEKGKGRKDRYVHIGMKTRKTILTYLETLDIKNPENKLWISKDGYQMTADGLSEIIRRIQKTLKIKPIYSLHDFRRYCAVTMYRQSHDLLMVSLYLGHASVDVTRRYLHIEREDIHAFGEKFSNMDKLSTIRPKRKASARNRQN